MDANMLGKQPGDKPLETSICQIYDKLPMLNIITPVFLQNLTMLTNSAGFSYYKFLMCHLKDQNMCL